jgi:hypothetical protein
MKSITVLLALCLLGLPAVAGAHPGHDHKIMGTISAIDGAKVTLKGTDGKEHIVELTSATKVVQGKVKSDARELKVGMRVVVNVGDGAQPLKAKEVQYSAAPTTAGKSS